MKVLSRMKRGRSGLEAEMRSEDRWVVGGITLALCVAGMAVHQLSDGDGAPKVNGGYYLALFARPAGATQERPGRSSAATLPRRGGECGTVDFETTDTIRRENPPLEPGVIRAPATEKTSA